MNFKQSFTFIVLALIGCSIQAQNVGIGTSVPDSSSRLEIQSTTQGILIPRMLKSERTLISNPATGLLVYQTDSTQGFYFYNGSQWQSLNSSVTPVTPITIGKIVYQKYNRLLNTADGLYIANHDGSNPSKINIIIPGYPNASLTNPRLTPDGTRVFFDAIYVITGTTSFFVYSCNPDGSNLIKVLDGGTGLWEWALGGVY